MQATAANLLNLIGSPKQFVIPIYQRLYSWKTEHCRKLLDDVLLISNGEPDSGHFIGSLVYFQEGIRTITTVPRLLLIDGQQRLTTITLLIAAMANFIEKNGIDVGITADQLRSYYLVNSYESGDLHFKLLLTKHDKETLINLLKGVPLNANSSQQIAANFKYFETQLSKENIADIFNGIQRLLVVDVALEMGKDNPQLIFESLNSTGLNLSKADLIRNFILMGQPLDLQTKLYEKFWSPMESSFDEHYAAKFDSFIRDFLSVKIGKIPSIENVYDEFKRYVQGGETPKDIAEVVQDISKFSTYYVRMVLEKEPENDLLIVFKDILRLKVDVSYPFLLNVYDDYANEILSKADFIEIVKLVGNYVFRRAICGIPTNSMNKTFANLHKSIRKDNYLESLKAAFQLMTSYTRFPNDAEFENALLVKDVYHFRLRNYLLDKLENFGSKEKVIVDGYTIEHILPQNPNLIPEWRNMLGENWKEIQERYLHTLGNLTLTGYNSELSDRSFTAKKTMAGGFDNSPIRLNGFLRLTEVWDAEQINKRASMLAKIAKNIWLAPNLSAGTLQNYKKSGRRQNQDYSIENYEHLQNKMLGIFDELRKRILGLDSSVREEFKKLYIAYKFITNFVDIVPQKNCLRLSLNIKFNRISDPYNLCKDVSQLGRWGNGDVEVRISKISDIDKAMNLVQQAFDLQSQIV